MARLPEHPCRTALVHALALLDQHGHPGAACHVAMALDALDAELAPLRTPAPLRAAVRRPD